MTKLGLAVRAGALGVCLLASQLAMGALGLKFVEGTSCAASPANIAITTTGGTATVSVCATTTLSERVCSATYPLVSTNAAANTAAVQVGTRTVTAPFTNVLDIVVFPATLSTTITSLANGVPASGAQGGGTGATVKIAELSLTIPSGLPGGTSYTFGIDTASAEVATADPSTTDCNDLSVAQISNSPAAAGFTLVTPAAPPTITITRNNASVNDNGSAITYTVTASQAPLSNLPITVTSGVTGTMTGVTNTCGTTVTILANATTATCTISATNTVPFDGPGTATVTVVAGSGYVVGAPASASGQIVNDDNPTVNVTASPTTLVDSASNVSTITVSVGVVTPSSFAVPLTVTVQDATRATTTCGSTINILAGASSATCTVTATPNTVAGDGNKTVTVAPNCTSTCTNGTTGTVTINDDDVPSVSVSASPTSLNDSAGQTSTITFSTVITSATPLSVNFTPPGASGRYTTNCTSPIVILANATSATCTVTAVANTDVGDGTATASFTVLAGTGYNIGATPTASVTINDDDKATITIAASPTTISENGGVSTVTITATAPVGAVLFATGSVSVTLTGTGIASTSRYTSTCTSPQVINFTGANTATKTCTITAINNALVDGDTSAVVTVGAAAAYVVGNPATATVTITDDDVGLSVSVITNAGEGGPLGIFRVCRTGSTLAAQVVNGVFSGTATSPADYSASGITVGVVTIPIGALCADVTITAVDDLLINPGRTIVLTISSPGAPAVVTTAAATMTIIDNDAPIAPLAPTVIPTLSPITLILLGLLLAGIAGFGMRRRPNA